MSTLIEIYNGASIVIGGPILAADDEDTRAADIFNAIIERERRRFLERQPWIGATRTDELAINTGVTEHARYTTAFDLPSDYLTIWQFNERRTENNLGLWDVETQGSTKFLWCDETSASVRMSFDVLRAGVTKISEEAATALMFILAKRAAGALGRKGLSISQLDVDAENAMVTALATNGQQGKKRYSRSQPLVDILDASPNSVPWD